MKKQIKEMKKDIHTVLRHNCKYDFCEGVLIGFNEEGIARELYDEGYRKQEWIFANSPFEMLDVAFKNLFPGVKYTAYFEPNIRDEPNGDKVLGLTDFGEDGEITIFIDCELTINNAVEIFAHELAHAAVGVEHDHDEAWEKAFDDLFVEYNRIGDEMFSSNINAPKGEDYSAALKKHLEGDNNDS